MSSLCKTGRKRESATQVRKKMRAKERKAERSEKKLLSQLDALLTKHKTTKDVSGKREKRRETVIDNLKRVAEIVGFTFPQRALRMKEFDPSPEEAAKIRADIVAQITSSHQLPGQPAVPTAPPAGLEATPAQVEATPAQVTVTPAPVTATPAQTTTTTTDTRAKQRLVTPAINPYHPNLYTPCPTDSPRTVVNKEIMSEGHKPKAFSLKFRRKMQTGNAVIDALAKLGKSADLEQKKIALCILSSSPVKRARCVSALAKVGLSRKAIIATRGKTIKEKLAKRINDPDRTAEYYERVGAFMERDDNSRMTADKNLKYKYSDGRVVQRRVLTDFTRPLLCKFNSENPDCQLGITSFKKYKPKHVAYSKELRKRSCLCQKCENLRLYLVKLQLNTKEHVPLSPHEFCEKYGDGMAVEMLMKTVKFANASDTITYKQWQSTKEEVVTWEWVHDELTDTRKRVKKTKTVDRTAPVSITSTRHQFRNAGKFQIADYREHQFRYSHQFKTMRDLRENMPSNHVEIQIDFAQSYACEATAGEVQSGWWNTPMVMISPIVMRYRAHDAAPLESKTFIYTSHIDKHNSEMIWAILHQFWTKDLPDTMGQEFVDNIDQVHYVSDSPFSQYRNRFLFFIISKHNALFGVKAIWNYLETGHGKGACDGAGSGVKRKLSQASKHGWLLADFKSVWEYLSQVTDSSMSFFKITDEAFEKALRDIEFLRTCEYRDIHCATLTHAVSIGKSNSPFSIHWRQLSCACENCIVQDFKNCTGEEIGAKWQSTPLFKHNLAVARGLKRRLTCGKCRIFCVCRQD